MKKRMIYSPCFFDLYRKLLPSQHQLFLRSYQLQPQGFSHLDSISHYEYNLRKCLKCFISIVTNSKKSKLWGYNSLMRITFSEILNNFHNLPLTMIINFNVFFWSSSQSQQILIIRTYIYHANI